VLDTAIDVARAMLHLHTQGVLHLDLKVCAVVGVAASQGGCPHPFLALLNNL